MKQRATTLHPLWLDFQRPAPGHQRPGLLLLLGSLALTALLLGQYVRTAGELAAAEQRVFALRLTTERQSEATGTGTAASTAAQSPQPPQASLTTAQWESLLASLEHASDDTVTLLGLAPTAREIAIEGEAKDLGASLAYVERLQTSGALSDVYLSRFEFATDHPRRPLRFSLSAQWAPQWALSAQPSS